MAAFALLVLAGARPAHAADIVAARYDAARDQIAVTIDYRRTNPDHEFTVRWGECSSASPARDVARLIDRQGTDAAREDQRTTERIALDAILCRPAIVTLRLGRAAHADVFVPRHIELLGGAPALGADAVIRLRERSGGRDHELRGVAVRYTDRERS